jgi:hypothetical protein
MAGPKASSTAADYGWLWNIAEPVPVYNESSSCIMTIDELEREYVPLRQQALAVRSYL